MEEDASVGMPASSAVAASPAILSAAAASTSPVPVPVPVPARSTSTAAPAAPAGDRDDNIMPTQTQMDENEDDGGEGGLEDDLGEQDQMEVDEEEEAGGGGESNNESGDSSGDDDEDDDGEDDTDEPSATTLGGSIPTPAYALLTGILDDPKKDGDDPTKRSVISVPITRLPAVLGRNHKTKDPNFFGLGDARLLSRNHVRIHYLDGVGGSLRSADDGGADVDSDDENKQDVGASGGGGSGGLVYHLRSADDIEEAITVGEIVRPASMKQLPPTGYFVLQCLGKNKIAVGGTGKEGRKISQGEAAVLQNGTTVRFAGFSLYFLLPKNAATTTSGGGNAAMMQVPNPSYAIFQKKRAREEAKAAAAAVEAEAAAAAAASSSAAAAAATAAKKVKTESSSATGTGGGGAKVGQAKVIADLEALPTSTLLQRCNEAVASDDAWGRPHQLLNSAVAVHAVMAAGRSSELQAVIEKHGGVTRGEVLNWVKNSSVFSGWVNLMMGKLEVKSYEKNISVAITRAGYTKHGHQRWAPPANLGKEEEKKGPQEKGDEEENSSENSGGSDNSDNEQGQFSEGGDEEVDGGEYEDDNDDDNEDDVPGEDEEQESGNDDESPQEEQSKGADGMQVDNLNASAGGADADTGARAHSLPDNEGTGDPRAQVQSNSPSTTKSFGTDDPDGALV